MIYKLGSYIKFLLTATNHHGVHSPFVYEYLTKCIYSKPIGNTTKTGHVLLGSIGYFKGKNARIQSYLEPLLKSIKAEYPSLCLDKKPYDLIYLDKPDLHEIANDVPAHIHNDSLMIVDAIHKNRANATRWKKIKEIKAVTVTIDLYHCGVVFFRNEQAKEHLRIRS